LDFVLQAPRKSPSFVSIVLTILPKTAQQPVAFLLLGVWFENPEISKDYVMVESNSHALHFSDN